MSVDAARGVLSTRRATHIGSSLASITLHAAALTVLTLMVTRPPPQAAPDETPVEMVFEQPPEPTPEVPPPVPRVETPPEPPSPELTPPIAEPPPPIMEAPPPEPVPIAPPPPRPPPPKPPPRPRPVQRQTERAPAERPALPGPTVTAPVAPTPPIVDQNWQASVSRWLSARKTYPEEARRRGEEGRVALRFTVDRSGRVVDASIVSSSGSPLLDEAALALLRQAVLPAFPPDMTQPLITITTTMRYSLR